MRSHSNCCDPGSLGDAQPSTAALLLKKYSVLSEKTASLFGMTSTKNQPPCSNECFCTSGMNWRHMRAYIRVQVLGPFVITL